MITFRANLANSASGYCVNSLSKCVCVCVWGGGGGGGSVG